MEVGFPLFRGFVNRCCAGRGRAAAGANVARALAGVVFFRRFVDFDDSAAGRFLEQSRQERPAPPAAGSGAKTFAQLARPGRFFDAEVVNDFPLRHVEAQA